MIKAKKSLGQNFLIDKNIINKIVNTVKIDNKTILEVGPGTGNLTNLILNKNPKKMYVIEKDDELIDLLNNDFKDKIEIIHGDILEVNENTISENKLIYAEMFNGSKDYDQEYIRKHVEKLTQ